MITITLWLVGAVHWTWFLNWGDLPFDTYDWADQRVVLSLLSDAAATMSIPFHSSGLMQDTSKFLGLPFILLTPDIALLPFMSLGTFVLVHTLIFYSMGCLGILLLARHLRWRPLATLLFFVLFNFNGYITSHLAVGHLTWLSYFLLPYFALLILRWVREEPSVKIALLLALLFCVFALTGSFHYCTWGMIFVIVLSFVRPRWMKFAALVVFASALLTMFRWMPARMAMNSFGWTVSEGYASLSHMLFGFVRLITPAWEVEGGMAWWEYDVFLGLTGSLFLLVFAVVPLGRSIIGIRYPKYSALALPIIVMLVLPYRHAYEMVLSNLPIFGTERVATRMIIMPVVILLALACTKANELISRGGRWRAAGWVLLGIITSQLFRHSSAWQVSEISSPNSAFAPLHHIVDLVDPVYEWVVVGSWGISIASMIFFLFVISDARAMRWAVSVFMRVSRPFELTFKKVRLLFIGMLIGAICTLFMDVSRQHSTDQNRAYLQQVYKGVKGFYGEFEAHKKRCLVTEMTVRKIVALISAARDEAIKEKRAQ